MNFCPQTLKGKSLKISTASSGGEFWSNAVFLNVSVLTGINYLSIIN